MSTEGRCHVGHAQATRFIKIFTCLSHLLAYTSFDTVRMLLSINETYYVQATRGPYLLVKVLICISYLLVHTNFDTICMFLSINETYYIQVLRVLYLLKYSPAYHIFWPMPALTVLASKVYILLKALASLSTPVPEIDSLFLITSHYAPLVSLSFHIFTTWSTNMASFYDVSMPDIQPNADIIGICGMNDIYDPDSECRRSDPKLDGWMLSGFYLLHQLFRDLGKSQA